MIWLIGVGGALGALFRFLFGEWCRKILKVAFPISTWLINIFGSFLLGYLVNLYLSGLIQEVSWSFLGIGFCGAFTTFSTFSLEVVKLVEENRAWMAIIYIGSSILLSILASYFGYIM
jgi:CrcB protein